MTGQTSGRGCPDQTLAASLRPSGQISLRAGHDALSPPLPSAVIERIVEAFQRGTGHGLLHLGAVEVTTELDPTLAFWRELGRQFVSTACGLSDPLDPAAVVRPEVDPVALARLARSVPPMRGAELVDIEVLEGLWGELSTALAQRAAEHDGGVQGYLEDSHSVWHVAGRICLHLAENKRDPEVPFAFIATYARQLPGRARVQHVPLSRALQEYASARDRAKLLALLTPVKRAAEYSELVRDLVDSGDIYHPLAWTAQEAYAFLLQVEALEQAGLVVRLPDWWKARRRPSVTVTVGSKAPSALGLGALLDFEVALTLDGEPLTAAEIRELLRASAGLVLIKGQWVEADPERLAEVLEHWLAVEARALAEGVSFAEAMRLLAGAQPAGEDAGEDLARPEWSTVVAGKWLAAQLETLRSPEVLAVIDANAGLRAQLRPYQRLGVHWLWTLYGLGLGGCLADDMGLGKTIQVIALLTMLHSREEGVDLLVVPASLVDNWSEELARFSPGLSVLIAHPSRIPSPKLRELPTAEVEAHQVVITTYGTAMRMEWMGEYPWRVVALDEAQAIKNPGAKQTRAVKELPSRWRLALTGTPVENRLGDLWSIFDFLNPGLLGSAQAFGRLCKSMASSRSEGYAPLRRLVSPYILRRLKTDRRVIADLPDKIEIKTHCLLTRVQAAHYEQAVQELGQLLETTEGMERRGAVLAYLLRFKQICNHPSQWLGDEEFDPDHSGKFARLAELCEPMAERQEKVLVFTQFRAMTGPLQRHLGEVFGQPGLVLHGGTPVKRRSELVRRFQEDEGAPFIVLSLKAGGTGLNLTAASHVVHFDRWWNPAVESQATDRAYRIGQTKNVLVHKFVCKGTVEERIDMLITGKQRLAEEVLTGGAEVRLTELSDDELLGLIRLDLESATAS